MVRCTEPAPRQPPARIRADAAEWLQEVTDMDEHQQFPQDATDGRPVDPETGRPDEPFFESDTVVPERSPAPGLTGDEADLEDSASSPE